MGPKFWGEKPKPTTKVTNESPTTVNIQWTRTVTLRVNRPSHWRIQGVKGGAGMCTLPPKLLHFHAFFGKNWPNNRLVSPFGVGAPSRLGNLGSATASALRYRNGMLFPIFYSLEYNSTQALLHQATHPPIKSLDEINRTCAKASLILTWGLWSWKHRWVSVCWAYPLRHSCWEYWIS